MPIVYAHRGGAALAPENTIAAFDNGVACGADGIEFDVHLSRDGVVVVHHDPTLERTTNGRGRIADHTAAELADVDAGFHFRIANGEPAFRGRGIGVPTLQQVLHRYPEARLIIELKTPERELAESVIREVRAVGATSRVAIGSYYTSALQAVREIAPDIATGAAKEETRWALYRSWVGMRLRAPRFSEFQVPESAGLTRIVSPRFVAFAHAAGLHVKVWTVNERADMERLLHWGVDALITDRPDLAVSVLAARTRNRGGL